MKPAIKPPADAFRPVVGVIADVREFDSYRWHAAPAIYLEALSRVARAAPVIIPSLAPDLNAADYLDRLDGLLLTGSRSNIHPQHYGIEPTDQHEPFDDARDATGLPFIRAVLERGLPLLAICRGMQELNVALGGSITAEIQTLPGRFDHRAPQSDDQDERFAIRHEVRLRPGGQLETVLGDLTIRVNSVHRQGIGRLADRLEIEATAEDGTIEAVRVRDAPVFALGVQWHPEYWAHSDGVSRRLFEAFGDALRTASARRREAAE